MCTRSADDLDRIYYWILHRNQIHHIVLHECLTEWKSRGTRDILHRVVAVGSRNIQKARSFVNNYAGGTPSVKAYGSYEEVYGDDVGESFQRCQHWTIERYISRLILSTFVCRLLYTLHTRLSFVS